MAKDDTGRQDPDGIQGNDMKPDEKLALNRAEKKNARKITKTAISLIADMDRARELNSIREDLETLQPYIDAELKKPEYDNLTLSDLLNRPATDENIQLLHDLTAIARAEKDKNLPNVQYNNTTELKTVTDKWANLFFSVAAPRGGLDVSGQRSFIPVKYEKDKSKKEITLFYDYSFDEEIIKKFSLSKRFTDKDFFVATIIDNLLDEGNEIITLSKIWREMGGHGSPTGKQLDPIYKTILSGMATIVTAEVSDIYTAWNISDNKSRDIVSPVIPVQMLPEKLKVNGKITDATIKITSHTPFYIVGANLGHLTTWPKEVLQLYTGRKTDRYYSVLRYLMRELAWMRNTKGKRGNKILYQSLYDYCGDKSTRDEQLTRNMMCTLLDEVFRPIGYITSYKEDNSGKPGVKLQYTKASQPRIKG